MRRYRPFLALLLGSALCFAQGPARADGSTRRQRSDITITWPGELDRAHGVRSGGGTPDDPYVISGWDVGNVTIRDTDAAIRIVDNTIRGTLTLNWIGPHVEVAHNDVGDLRVNENIARWGDPTSGMIMHNTFGVVGQLRHFDGMFAANTVGAPEQGLAGTRYPDARAVNFDGFNGARFERNTIYGFVEARLHGHHHSSSFSGSSHLHADGPNGEEVDHAHRYHRVVIAENRIFSSAEYALAYVDTNHAANDRTANSETNPYLNAPHVHHTRVRLARNVLTGAGILVDVFNAADERHRALRRGSLAIVGNRISLSEAANRPFGWAVGIRVARARAVALRIGRNAVLVPPPVLDPLVMRQFFVTGAGISLESLDDADVLIDHDRVANRWAGVEARHLTGSVRWEIRGLETSGVAEPVSYDGSVRNAPATG